MTNSTNTTTDLDFSETSKINAQIIIDNFIRLDMSFKCFSKKVDNEDFIMDSNGKAICFTSQAVKMLNLESAIKNSCYRELTTTQEWIKDTTPDFYSMCGYIAPNKFTLVKRSNLLGKKISSVGTVSSNPELWCFFPDLEKYAKEEGLKIVFNQNGSAGLEIDKLEVFAA